MIPMIIGKLYGRGYYYATFHSPSGPARLTRRRGLCGRQIASWKVFMSVQWRPRGGLKFQARVVLLVAVLALLASPALPVKNLLAQERSCPGANIVVSLIEKKAGPGALELCADAKRGLQLLAQCGLAPKYTIRLEVVNKVVHPLGDTVIADFDARENVIQLISLARFSEVMGEGGPWHGLPHREVYASYIIHEISHAVFWQSSKAMDLPISAHEYVAHVFQLASLHPDTRGSFLEAFPGTAPSDLSSFNMFYFNMAPLAFTAKAYRHFAAQDDQCGFIRSIARGQIDFPLTEEWE